MANERKQSPLSIALRALGAGLGTAIVLPLIVMFGVLGLAHLAADCGRGSSGGCEMGAASVGFVAIVPAFVIGCGLSLFRDLRRRSASDQDRR